MKRKLFIASSLSAAVAACSPVGTKLNEQAGFRKALAGAERLDEVVIGAHGMARGYSPHEISADFPINSLDTPADALYRNLVAHRFRNYHLMVGGAVERPRTFTLQQLHGLPQQTQITRHDCVEGWSAIAQWDGPRLADLLAAVRPRSEARYVVFRSFDRDGNGVPYYESLSLPQAMHPQTLLALRQNGAPITADRGAPVRLRVPLQLGYKSAKWVARIDLVPSLALIYGGKGGYWEDQGYEWYAGI